MGKGKAERAFRIAGIVAGILAVVLFRRNLSAEASMMGYFGLLPPGLGPGPLDAAGIAAAAAASPLLGLLLGDFFDLVNVFLVALLMVPVARDLRTQGDAKAGIALAGFGASLALYGLSFALRDPGIARAGLLLLYGSGFLMGLALGGKRGYTPFAKWSGLLANGIGLLYFPLAALGASIDFYAIVAAAPFTVAWQGNLVLRLVRNKG